MQNLFSQELFEYLEFLRDEKKYRLILFNRKQLHVGGRLNETTTSFLSSIFFSSFINVVIKANDVCIFVQVTRAIYAKMHTQGEAFRHFIIYHLRSLARHIRLCFLSPL